MGMRPMGLPVQQQDEKANAPMTKRAESKYKINRRLGINLWGRPKSPVNKREYGPGQHGQRRKKPTDFGTQLMAKQKLKGYYGNISEKQFRKYYEEAVRRKGDTSENLIEILERRLDAVYLPLEVRGHAVCRPSVRLSRASAGERQAGEYPVLSGEGQRHDRGKGEVQAARRGAGRDPEQRAGRAGVSGGGPPGDEGPVRPRAKAVGRAVSGADGTEPGGRVLLAVGWLARALAMLSFRGAR